MIRLAGLPLLCSVTACAPVSPRLAAEQCADRARAATGPTGGIAIEGGSGGLSTGVTIGITSDFVRGRDPFVVYDQCVRQKTGQAPIAPLVL